MSKEIEETIKRINEKVKKMDKGHNFFIDYEQEHKDLKLIFNYIENSIPKEKVEEKIKELINEQSKVKNNKLIYSREDVFRFQIYILEELLEEK